MKQKNSSALTKQDLQEAIKKVATSTDVQGVKQVINDLTQEITALKKDTNTVKHDVKSIRNELDTIELRLDIKLDKLEMAIDDNARQYRDDVLTKLSETMGELEKIREDRELASYHTSELEKRIKKLEQMRQAA